MSVRVAVSGSSETGRDFHKRTVYGGAEAKSEESCVPDGDPNDTEKLPLTMDSALMLSEYILLRDEIRHQDNLLNARLSWLVSSQAFLLSGFAVTLTGTTSSFLPIYVELNRVLVACLPVAGMVTDLVSYATIWAAILRMRHIRCLAHGWHPPNLPMVQAEPFERRLALAGPVLIPIIFLAVWSAIIIRKWM